MKEYDLPKLAQASDKDLVEFLGQNERVIGEVTAHIANLERLKGTSQAHALGYQEYLPDEITMQDFDTHLSKKGYQMSTEALHTILLVAASAAVVAGIGIIAYKLIKASMAKEPKSADFLKKQKDVQMFAMHLVKVNWGDAAQPTREALKTQFLADCVNEVTVGMSDADLLNDTFNAYVRSEFKTAGVPYMSLVAGMRGPASIFSGAATIYLTNVKESLEAFRRDFLDVIANAPDITDHQMINLVSGLKWNQIDNGNAAGVQALMSWVNAMGIPASNKLEEALRSANDILAAPATLEQIRAYDQNIQDELVGEGTVPKVIALIQSLKATGKYIEGSKSNFTAGEKRSQQVVDLYKHQIDRAMLLADTVPLISPLVTLESDKIVLRSKCIANAGKRLLNAVESVADKLEDKEQAKELREALDEIAKASKQLMKMKTESLEDNFPARVSFGSMMDLQAKNVWMDLLKSVAVVALIGLAVFAIQAVVLSMLGLQSMAASFAGGIVYFNKNGKRITPGEAADAVAKTAESKNIGKYGCYMLSKNQGLPFKLTRHHLDSNFKQCSDAIKKSLSEFGSELPRGNVTDADLIKASEAGMKHIKRAIPILEGRLKDMKVPIKGGDPAVKATVHNLRDSIDAFNAEWFDKEKADYPLVRRGIDTTWFGVMDEKMSEHVDKAATDMTDGIIAFGKNVPSVTKEELANMSPEAQETHANYTQALAYLNTLAFAIGEVTKKAVADGGRAMQAVRENLKMNGENVGGIEVEDDFGGDDIVQYQEDFDPLVDAVSAMSELYPDEQMDVVMATENRKVMIGRLLMTAGIVIILGAGAYLLISMSQNRRKGSSFATDKIFKQIENDLKAGLASEELAAQMKAQSEEFADGIQRDLKRAREQAEANRKANEPQEKEVKGQRVDPVPSIAPTQPSASTTGTPVGGSNTAAQANPETTMINGVAHSTELLQIAKDVDTLIENIGKFDYKGPLRNYLIERTPGMVALHFACGSFDRVSEGLLLDRSNRQDKLTALMTHVMEQIVEPVVDVVRAPSGYEEKAEQVYDKVVAAIEKAKADADTEKLTDEAYMANSEEDIANWARPSTEKDVIEAMQKFNPNCVSSAERSYLAEAKQYHSLSQDLDSMWKDNKDFFNREVGERFNELKGNRDWTSKLIRRLEEFKPTFNIIARSIKTHVAMSDVIFEGTEFALRVHRRVQRDLIKSIEFQKLKASEIKARMGGTSPTLDELDAKLQDALNKYNGNSAND